MPAPKSRANPAGNASRSPPLALLFAGGHLLPNMIRLVGIGSPTARVVPLASPGLLTSEAARVETGLARGQEVDEPFDA